MKSAAPDIRAYLSDAAGEELARRHLLDFARLVNPAFETPPHVQYLASLLERVERHEITRLAISAPPGHGKSTLLQSFLAWFCGRDAHRRVLAISASESLAKRNSRDAQALVAADQWPFDVTLTTESVLDWTLSGGGSVRAIGKGGTVTGFRAELILVDDLQADAGSDVTRASDEDWFRSVLSTRLEPKGVVVVIATRWHDEDLIGRLLEGESRGQWMHVNLPVFADEKDVLARRPGQVLWESRWPAERLEDIKSEVGSRAFGAQYLGDPAPADGAFYKPAWLEHYYNALPAALQIPETVEDTVRRQMFGEAVKPQGLIVVQAIDSAWKTSLSSDYSVIATIATDLVDFYIVDVWRQRVQYPELRRVAIERYDLFRPRIVYCEEAASGYAVTQELKSSTTIPIVGVKPVESKEARAEAVLPLWESGRVKLRTNAPWKEELVAEFLRFPVGRHDDMVDALNLGLAQLWEYVRQYHTRRRSHANVFPWKER